MTAFFQSGLFPYLFPNRFILPMTFEVLTWRTFTLKRRSTADWISILLAFDELQRRIDHCPLFVGCSFSNQRLSNNLCGSFMMRVPLRSFQPLDGVKSDVDDLRYHRHLGFHNGGHQFQDISRGSFQIGMSFIRDDQRRPPLEIFSALQERAGLKSRQRKVIQKNEFSLLTL